VLDQLAFLSDDGKLEIPFAVLWSVGGGFGEKPWVGLEPEWAMVFDDPKIRC